MWLTAGMLAATLSCCFLAGAIHNLRNVERHLVHSNENLKADLLKCRENTLTAQEKRNLGLLNRLAAQELLTLSKLTEEELEAERDYVLRLTEAYNWSSDVAGAEGIFGQPSPPREKYEPKDDPTCPKCKRVLALDRVPDDTYGDHVECECGTHLRVIYDAEYGGWNISVFGG